MPIMQVRAVLDQTQLAALAKRCRVVAGKSRAQAARDMGIKHPGIFHAEESPKRSLAKLRKRLIEAYSNLRVIGPIYVLTEKQGNRTRIGRAPLPPTGKKKQKPRLEPLAG